jgi:hypothetical protein
MRAAVMAISVAIITTGAATESSAQPPQSQSAHTVDITIACPKEDDFVRYATLLLDDISAAILFENDHNCVALPTGTFVRVDKGSVQRDFSHVCIRPVGAYDCLWTFAALEAKGISFVDSGKTSGIAFSKRR